MGFTDFHCHILPFVDDGSASVAASLEMAEILRDSGFTALYCTPHIIRGGYETPPSAIRDKVFELQTLLHEKHIAVRLHAGAEYYMDDSFLDYLDGDALMTGGSILVEPAVNADLTFLLDTIHRIVRKGITPLLAHPERCATLSEGIAEEKSFLGIFRKREQRECSSAIDTLKSMGCLFQGNIGSFAGVYGRQIQRNARMYLEKGYYEKLGSDAHSPRNLERTLQRGLEAAGKIAGREALRNLLS